MKEQILKNLSGRVYPINAFAAIRGVDDISTGMNALNELIAAGVVHKIDMSRSHPGAPTMYKKAPSFV